MRKAFLKRLAMKSLKHHALELRRKRAHFNKLKHVYVMGLKRRQIVYCKRRATLKEMLGAWYDLVSSGEYLNYECASIHHRGKLTTKVFKILALNMQKSYYF